ncbi:Copper amine oxidase N-terminal domain-containing protein [Paenibacillus sp. UNCCL117]|uniref:stalk domain-containing protein n=1 Tax=unclassified Paenibacillus TaxID=185978 RepID=UPI00088864CB|nr:MULTISPECIES: stalk domain-containing protein [unclassified Paenibacillus]SDC95939.1 Copper amine oxidase N-terminal domain-containing protein [Paenibacillus sp. cl123]SFW30180.1 Copper amine oxidase N-terminal domain-containing protein [Paenibacillus sp. UNCCL117]
MRELLKRRGSRVVTALLVILLLLSLSLNVLGADSLTEVRVYLNTGIKIMLNGKTFEPVDPDDGTKLVPITYRGTTYLPMRAVAEAAGVKVAWDGNTETAYLGEVEGTFSKDSISYIKASPEFVYNGDKIYRLASRTPEELKMGEGKQLDYGYVTGGSRSVNMEVMTNFNYSKFKAKIWSADSYFTDDLIVSIIDENKVTVKELKVKPGTTTELELNIKDTKLLRIYVQGDKSIVGEPMLGK